MKTNFKVPRICEGEQSLFSGAPACFGEGLIHPPPNTVMIPSYKAWDNRTSLTYTLVVTFIFLLIATVGTVHLYWKVKLGQSDWFSSGDAIPFYIVWGGVVLAMAAWAGSLVLSYVGEFSRMREIKERLDTGRWPYGLFFTPDALILRETDCCSAWPIESVIESDVFVRTGWTKAYFLTISYKDEYGHRDGTILQQRFQLDAEDLSGMIAQWIEDPEGMIKNYS